MRARACQACECARARWDAVVVGDARQVGHVLQIAKLKIAKGRTVCLPLEGEKERNILSKYSRFF